MKPSRLEDEISIAVWRLEIDGWKRIGRVDGWGTCRRGRLVLVWLVWLGRWRLEIRLAQKSILYSFVSLKAYCRTESEAR